MPTVSIDQNCHPLWDVAPKLHALVASGRRVAHLVEDVDIAFTRLGAAVDSRNLEIARERFHRSGGQDWGAAMFYSAFLGRLPVEIRQWEPYTGLKTSAVAKKLGRSVDDLYDEFSPADNWQLIGSSYVGDKRHHRAIGDLSVAETAPSLRELVSLAREQMLRTFCEKDAQDRITGWFDEETARLEKLIGRQADGTLADLYASWLGEHVGQTVTIARASEHLALGAEPDGGTLLRLFLRDYERVAGLYNQALEDTDSDLHPLRTDRGELPFFALVQREGRQLRTDVRLLNGALLIGEQEVPLGEGGQLPTRDLQARGVRCLAGKALLLVIQVRLQPGGADLALPFHGSLYMPAAHRFSSLLQQDELLSELRPVVRVRFRLLDRMRSLDTVICPPKHVAEALGGDEIPAAELSRQWESTQQQAGDRLESFRSEEGRAAWQREACQDLVGRIEEIDRRKRELANTDPKGEEIRSLGKDLKGLQTELLDRTLRRVAADWQLSQLDYWDSRGALLPWCIALGGEEFYHEVISAAELYEERPGTSG